jgi:hypothetical protein
MLKPFIATGGALPRTSFHTAKVLHAHWRITGFCAPSVTDSATFLPARHVTAFDFLCEEDLWKPISNGLTPTTFQHREGIIDII